MCHSVAVTPGRSRLLTAVIAWCVGAMTAVAVGLFALSSIDFGLTDRSAAQPLGGAAPSPTPDASQVPGPSADPSPATSQSGVTTGGVERTITSAAGTVVARCTSAGAYLVSWSPAQGFRSDDVRRGPAAIAHVTFQSLTREYYVSVRCVAGVPQGSFNSQE